MSILEVHHIEKHFGATQVLNDISFSLEKDRPCPSSVPPAAVRLPCCGA